VVYALATFTHTGKLANRAVTLGGLRSAWFARDVDQLIVGGMSVVTAVLAMIAIILVAGLNRGLSPARRWTLGLRMAVAVVGSGLTAEALKETLPAYTWWKDSYAWGGGPYPSGHTAIAASLTLALLSVSTPRWRPLLIGPLLAGVVVTATGTITLAWHLPSDVLGGLLVAVAWHRLCLAGVPVRRVTLAESAAAGIWWLASTVAVVAAGAIGALFGPSWSSIRESWPAGLSPAEVTAAYVGSLGLVGVAVALALLGTMYPAGSDDRRQREAGVEGRADAETDAITESKAEPGAVVQGT
jgi:membrane-associated phospholipid phosphatase